MTQTRYIKKTEPETNKVQHRSSLLTFYNKKWGFLYTVYELLINWPLSRALLAVGACFSDEVAVI